MARRVDVHVMHQARDACNASFVQAGPSVNELPPQHQPQPPALCCHPLEGQRVLPGHASVHSQLHVVHLHTNDLMLLIASRNSLARPVR